MRVAVLTCLSLLTGCDGMGTDQAARTEIAALRSEVESLKSQLETQRQRAVDSNGRIQALELASKGEWAFLDPAGGTGYSMMQTSVAPLMVSFVDSSPVGDGTKVRLQVGNMTSATFSGVGLVISYNRRVPQDVADLEKWNADLRNSSADLTDSIYPGTWNTVSVSLPGIKPEELGYLAIKGKLNVISLREK